MFNDAELDEIIADSEPKAAPTPVQTKAIPKQEVIDDDSDNESINDEINNLKFS